MDIISATEPVIITQQVDTTSRHYPLNYVVPLYQPVTFGEFFKLDLLLFGASLNAAQGIDLSVLPDWLQFDFVNKRFVGTPIGLVRGDFWIDLVIDVPDGNQWPCQLLISTW